ncbi:MAG: DnaA regulatory inactivator Hda [Gammaproteobacteria bacterium]|nr:DnaA regulatory inactivator Hda [Gammaproteobacteria bacterium]
MPGPIRQLVLPFPVNQRCVFDNFQVGRNNELIGRLRQLPGEPGFGGLFLWGTAGAGVSHLLQAACQHYAEQGRQIAYLPFAQLGQDPDNLEGMDGYDLVAVDDVQAWAAEPACEIALVGLYQNLLARGRQLLVGGAAPVAESGFELADLVSRLASLSAYEVQPLNDAGKAELLRRLAGERGLTLGDAVLNFWLARSERAVDVLLAQLDAVDDAAMSAQRTVTIPLLKSVLDL